MPLEECPAAQKVKAANKGDGRDAQIEAMRDRMIEVDHVEHPGATDFLRSFLVAGQANITSGRENAQAPT